MSITRRGATIGGINLLTGAVGSAVQAQWGDGLVDFSQGLEEFWLATDAYIFGYPLVTVFVDVGKEPWVLSIPDVGFDAGNDVQERGLSAARWTDDAIIRA